jgi:hypothetical protein
VGNPSDSMIQGELKRLMGAFFRAVSFETGEKPAYDTITELFIAYGLLIKNSGPAPEICDVASFIKPRQASVDAGELTRFHEAEVAGVTEVFGNVAHRFCSYVKSGALKGAPFEARGMISTQFILTGQGWKMTCMAWDDERPGLEIASHQGLHP